MKRRQLHKTPAKRERKRRKKQPATRDTRVTIPHKVYGPIPLVEKKVVGTDGIERHYLDFDPEYQPRLPAGAVRGDISQQVFCSICHVPRYFYVDEQRGCIQCGKTFVFSAKEQKFWYERLKFNFHVQAVRCLTCRRKKRSEQAVRNQLLAASTKSKEEPEDPLALLAYSEAVAAHFALFDKGNLNKAIGCARKAYKRSPRLYECLFWEARCQQLAGRPDKAAELFDRCIREASPVKRCRALVRRAKELKQS